MTRKCAIRPEKRVFGSRWRLKNVGKVRIYDQEQEVNMNPHGRQIAVSAWL
jgi:hypothetical protein